MKKHYLQLPRGYISQGQIVLWTNDRQRYIDIYMDGRDELRYVSAAMEYGKQVADALEKETETDDLLTDSAISLLPKYDTRDVEFFVDMKTKGGWLKLIIKPDTLDSTSKDFREYKTGVRPWTQKKADDHFQLKFYALGIYTKWGVIPKCHLDWIETEWTSEGVKPTGRVESFEVVITLSDILKTMAHVTKIAKEIETEFAHHVTNSGINTF